MLGGMVRIPGNAAYIGLPRAGMKGTYRHIA
jgi:hypothetical protein